MLSAVKKYSFRENMLIKLGGVYAMVIDSTDPPVPTEATVNTILFVGLTPPPPNLLGANVIVLPTAYPNPPVVTPTPPEVVLGCPTSLRTRLIVNSAPEPAPDVDVCVTS